MTRQLSIALVSAAVLSGVARDAQVAPAPSADLASVAVLVEDANGVPISGLSRGDFEVWSEGQRLPIEAFSPASGSRPLTLVVLVDITASLLNGPGLAPLTGPIMTSQYSIRGTTLSSSQVGAAFGEFDLQGFGPHDRVRVGSIGRRLTLSDASVNNAAIKKDWKALFDVPPVEWLGPSPIWDSVAEAGSVLGGESGHRAIVLITDGQASGNKQSHSEVSVRAALAGISVSVVALESMLPTMPLTSMASHGVDPTETLRDMAAVTGGSYGLARAEFAPGDQTFTRNPAPLFKRTLDALHQAYVLHFVPRVADGKPHPLDIRVSKPGAVVRARKIYAAALAQRAEASRLPY